MSAFHSPADRALVEGRSLYQPKRPGFWLLASALLVGGSLGVPTMASTISQNPTAALLAIVLVGLFGIAVYWVLATISYLDPKPSLIVLGALALGGLFATSLAPILGLSLDHMTAGLGEWGPAVSAATAEETYKALAVVMVMLTAPWWWRRTLDGFVVGALVGLGFQLWEDVTYIAVGAGGATPDAGESLTIFFDRVILSGVASHAAYAAVFGAGLAYAISHHGSGWKRWSIAVGGFLIAWTAHLFWDSPLFADLTTSQGRLVIYSIIKSLPLLIVIFLIGRRAVRNLRSDFSEAAETEVESQALDPHDVSTILTWSQRRNEKGDMLHHLRRTQTDLVRLHLHTMDTSESLDEQRTFIRQIEADQNRT